MLVPDRSIADVFCVRLGANNEIPYSILLLRVSNLFGSVHESQIAVYISNVLDYSTQLNSTTKINVRPKANI